MGCEAPDWLTKEFIKHALENGKGDDSVTVDNIEVDKPIAKGDNYVCEIFRAKVDYRKLDTDDPLKMSLIIKAPIADSKLYEILMKMGIIQREGRIYKEYLPKMASLINCKHDNITVKSFHSDRENVLVLEDLKFSGYVMADRQKQLDYEHCVVALKALALYHAASVKLHEQDPEFVEGIGKELFLTEAVAIPNQDLPSFNFQVMAEESKMTPELSQYTGTFTKFSEIACDMVFQLVNPNPKFFNVLNHGDFWVNNMMFQYDNEKPVGVKLLDLQIARYTSPAIDLHYFFYGSVQEDIRVSRKDDLLQVYLQELNRNLEIVGTSQRLTESELRQMMESTEFFGLYVSLALYPFVIANPKKCVLEMKDVKEEDFKDVSNTPFSEFYRSKRYIDTLVKRLGEFENKDWFVI